jgi:hypothetical protein
VTAKDFRQILIDLFGSRLNARLELDLLQLRVDYDTRLRDRDQTIEMLRGDIGVLQAKIVVYENTILPHVSRLGAEVINYQKPKTPTKPSWAMEGLEGQMESSWQREVRLHEEKLAEMAKVEMDKVEPEKKSVVEVEANG